jgi:protein-tyrosine phosphatase
VLEQVDAAWLELDGAVNVRDLAGTPARDGAIVVPRRLIRADNLQGLSPRDIHLLVEDCHVRRVADMRTSAEVFLEGPGPLHRESRVTITHLSLYPEGTDVDLVDTDDGPTVLPGQAPRDSSRRGAANYYLGYTQDRPDSVLTALRLIAEGSDSAGSTIVHCAAGKDRTGVIVALALSAIGAPAEAIVADYVRSAERITAILARLAGSRTYAGELDVTNEDRHRPRPETMANFLQTLDAEHGGAQGWLAGHSWIPADQQRLEAALLVP